MSDSGALWRPGIIAYPPDSMMNRHRLFLSVCSLAPFPAGVIVEASLGSGSAEEPERTHST
ncbi:hypothetical protein ABC733_16850 [Mangrovibacter sp. SLW1]